MKMKVPLFQFFLVVMFTSSSPRRHGVDRQSRLPDEQRLLKKLTDEYEPSVRPVINSSSLITVRFGLTLVQLLDMDEVNQVLTSNVWLEQEWTDERLTWDPAQFNGLKTLRIPCDKIWLPDVVLYNSADDFTEGFMQSRAMVRHTGSVFWAPPAKLRSSCKIDITFFPFDDQICILKFGSWTYDGFQVDFVNRSAEVDLSNYVFSGEWELLDVSVQRNDVYYLCCDEPFPDVTFKVLIRRRTLYYLINIIIPCLWLTALSLLCFWLPSDSGEKITLGITVLLAYTVFMLLVAESMPATSEFVPVIGIFLTITMTMTSISIILTVFILQLHHSGPSQTPVPRCLRHFLFTCVAQTLRIQKIVKDQQTQKLPDRPQTTRHHSETCDETPPSRYSIVPKNSKNRTPCHHLSDSDVEEDMLFEEMHSLLVGEYVNEDTQRAVNEWRLAAHIMDRLLFWLYLIGAAASSLIVLVLIPMTKPNLL